MSRRVVDRLHIFAYHDLEKSAYRSNVQQAISHIAVVYFISRQNCFDCLLINLCKFDGSIDLESYVR